MDWLGLLQWPAMVASIGAAWLVASKLKGRRLAGFWVYMLSNVLWIAWGWKTSAWALLVLQVCLGLMNVRGIRQNDESESGPS